MRTIHRWTSDEDKVVMKCIKENPSNIYDSLNRAADRLGLTFPTVKYRYYKHLSKTNHCFLTISEKKAFKNRKVIKVNTSDAELKEHKDTLAQWLKKLSKIFK